ncbi:hypothetical protein [Nonomuraea sp. NEAU-A123]|uniref:hypothetical protein n=1 Tax=Nonomuraea sp. NEAU-A123 TaxID=2839649 RepID=UPI001BE4C37D|nr:hypothetical protein [Nonomuraea sp. NEAU-A123]MBT2227959.1 hypothetical protein [Nonomuraea sp. NEAU-A123]
MSELVARRTLVSMNAQRGAPFSYVDIRPYVVAESLDELRGPVHGVVTLPHELEWSGRRRFDLDDPYDLGAFYKIVLEEGRQEHLRALLNGETLRHHWSEFLPARRVRALWEKRFPELRRAAA